ncbi:MAG: T9SS type A sorting domain-containing protein [Bacteroidia bacterium]|nr:T9SS type A sorting domain-containing protein [Bacteroidia bacterium]
MKLRTKLFVYLFTIYAIAAQCAQAQLVYIPDANFRNWIASNYPGAIIGDSLEISNTSVVNELYISCDSLNISDLTGIQYFVNAINISVVNNTLTTIPALPNNLLSLDCSINNLNTLPTLPNSLNTLYCYENNLSSLPSPLPTQLLDLACDYNSITSLPALPLSLIYLSCGGNLLTSLPVLPPSLTVLFFDANAVNTMPLLPASLEILSFASNKISIIPELPISLTYLDCSYNTDITCLPKLHELDELRFDGTGITCIPNMVNVTFSSPLINTVPICDVFNNPNNCDFYWNISGRSYLDSSANCMIDSNSLRIKNIPIQLLHNGNILEQTTSSISGSYVFDTQTNGIFEIMVDTNGLPFNVICPANNMFVDTLTATDTLKTNRDFGLQCKNGLYVGIRSIHANSFVPAATTIVTMNIGDLSLFYGMHCAAGESGVVTVTINGPVTYLGAAAGALTPTSVSGNTLSYTVTDFGVLNSGAFAIEVQTDTTALLGTPVCFHVTLNVTNTAGLIKTDSLLHCYVVVSSFDPNDKRVSPLNDIDINGNGWLTYTINFQNTGTAPASDIYLLDTLDSNLDLQSFKLLDYSHPLQTQLLSTGMLRFNFPNINLPDSNSNEPLSHGYVQFKIKLKSGLQVGTQIKNTAYIYFDFNQPVVTNTTQNVLVNPTAINEMSSAQYNFFPNPANDVLYVSIHKPVATTGSIIILDLQGRTVIEEAISKSNPAAATINVSGLAKGIYFLKLNETIKRFVKL